MGWRIWARGIRCCPSLFPLPDQRLHIVNNSGIYTHTYCVQTVYELPLLLNDTAVKHFYTIWSGAKCDWVFIIGVLDWRCLGKYVTLDRTSFKQEVAAAQLLPHFVPYRIYRRGLY